MANLDILTLIWIIGSPHLNVSVDYLIIMEVLESLEDLLGVEDDGGFVVFQRSPFGAQQRRQTSFKQEVHNYKQSDSDQCIVN